jgi:hypothetical protein
MTNAPSTTGPESIVTSLDWSKKLKEAGWPQDVCHFKYCGGHTWFHDDQENGKFEPCEYDGVLESDEYCPRAELTCEFTLAAPTAEEVLRRLPPIVRARHEGGDEIGCPEMKWYPTLIPAHFTVGYMGDKHWITHGEKMLFFEDASLANAAAQMYIHLSQNNLLPSS